MSLNYLIDGYNVLKQIPYLTDKQLNQGRQSLLDLIKKYRLCGKNKATVVFDGRDDIVAPPHRSPYVIIFSENESADDLIKRMVEKANNPKIVVVVTDDKELRFRVKSLGAGLMTVKEFSQKISKKESLKEEHHKADLKNEDANRITEELKDLWLKNDNL